MPSEHASAELLGALSKLLTDVTAAPLALEVPGVDEVRSTRAEMVDQLSDYVIPRLVQLEAPLLTVVGGSTGAGKSTLVNSLVGEQVTQSGVLRPTTRSPVLVHHPDDAEWFQPDRILPELPRTKAVTNDVYALRLAPSTGVPRGLAILDAPDIDSIDAANRELATQLLAAADLWLFVTSAARYADQVPWDYLGRAAERSTSVAVVLDRTHADAVVEVRGHLARMMTSRGLSDSPLFTVPESAVGEDGLLPREAVEPIRGWLRDLAADPEGRSAVVFGTLDGAVRHNVLRSHVVADGLDEQLAAARQLHDDATRTYAEAVDLLRRATADGTVMRGEVLTRWQEFVGNGELLRSVEERVSRIRDRLVDQVTGKRTRSAEVSEAVESGLQTLLVEQLEAAAEAVYRSWSSVGAGRALIASERGLDRASRDVRVKAERLVRDWQAEVLELVRAEGSDKRLTAKFLAFGVNGIGVALMVLVFVSGSAGLTGAEVGVAGGTAVVAQKLLEAIFGDQAVRRLAERAHTSLVAAVEALATAESRRYLDLVSDPALIEASQARLRDAARRAEYARHIDFLDGETAS
ncbi:MULTISPECIES: dynamin family protein [unclassified Aeromicrobium]|uniref:dynamin family protein n=1 Tax=unclassified Aeromicrobium TaxID=2633570 RepID=UPI000B2A14A3|nr:MULTISPECIES: dynamin family protein [unclassified Aeromicrobium]